MGIQVKEIKFRPGTDEGDYQVKLRNLRRFLEGGDKAKVTIRFRGREMAHQEIGIELLNRVKGDLEDIANCESFPRRVEGRQMIMVLAPIKKEIEKKNQQNRKRKKKEKTKKEQIKIA